METDALSAAHRQVQTDATCSSGTSGPRAKARRPFTLIRLGFAQCGAEPNHVRRVQPAQRTGLVVPEARRATVRSLAKDFSIDERGGGEASGKRGADKTMHASAGSAHVPHGVRRTGPQPVRLLLLQAPALRSPAGRPCT